MSQKQFICPYNPTHVMKPLSAHRHVIACRKVHLALDYAICPFNALHHVPRTLEMQHLAVCEDRQRLVSAHYVEYYEEPAVSGRVSLPPPVELSTEGENWDDESFNCITS